MKQDDFDIIWHRVKKLTGWKKQNDLGEFLGIEPPGISKAKKLGLFRMKWAQKIAATFGTTAEEILYGAKATDKNGKHENINHLEDPIITDLKLWLNELNGEDPDHAAWFRVEIQNKSPEFKEWRQKKGEAIASQDLATG